MVMNYRQHAAAVVQIMHVLFNCAGGLRESLLITDISMLGCYLSACAIDFEHPGEASRICSHRKTASSEIESHLSHGPLINTWGCSCLDHGLRG